MNCVFPMEDCCNPPSQPRTEPIAKIVFILSDMSASDLCSQVKLFKADSYRPDISFAHFSIGMDGSISKLLNIDRSTSNQCSQSNAIYINIESDSVEACATLNYEPIYDSLFRVVCCIHKELDRTTALRLITGDVCDANKDIAYKALKVTLAKILSNLEKNCLTLMTTPNVPPCLDCYEEDCICESAVGNSSCSTQCCDQTNQIANLTALVDSYKSQVDYLALSFNQFKINVDKKVNLLERMSTSFVAMQEYFGANLACFRKLCGLTGCVDCKVNYSIFRPITVFTGVDTPLNFDTKITDNDPSYVSTGGYFKFCPDAAGNYSSTVSDLSINPSKYCAGDTIELISSVSGVVYTYTVAADSQNLVVSLPAVAVIEPLNGGCLSYSLKITSKDYLNRVVSGGNIVIFPLL
jgi:hypothetical protein